MDALDEGRDDNNGSGDGVPSIPQEDYRNFHRRARSGETPSLGEVDRSALIALIDAIKREHAPTASTQDEDEGVASSFSINKVLTPHTLVAAFFALSSGFAVFYGVKSDLADLRNKSEQNKTTIEDMIRNRDEFRKKFEPAVAIQDKINETQDLRIQNIVGSVTQLRDSISDLAKVATQTHEDMAVMKSMIQQRQSGPRGN
jgi:hypothetical protein